MDYFSLGQFFSSRKRENYGGGWTCCLYRPRYFVIRTAEGVKRRAQNRPFPGHDPHGEMEANDRILRAFSSFWNILPPFPALRGTIRPPDADFVVTFSHGMA